jgi:hypothetical protein
VCKKSSPIDIADDSKANGWDNREIAFPLWITVKQKRRRLQAFFVFSAKLTPKGDKYHLPI